MCSAQWMSYTFMTDLWLNTENRQHINLTMLHWFLPSSIKSRASLPNTGDTFTKHGQTLILVWIRHSMPNKYIGNYFSISQTSTVQPIDQSDDCQRSDDERKGWTMGAWGRFVDKAAKYPCAWITLIKTVRNIHWFKITLVSRRHAFYHFAYSLPVFLLELHKQDVKENRHFNSAYLPCFICCAHYSFL